LSINDITFVELKKMRK